MEDKKKYIRLDISKWNPPNMTKYGFAPEPQGSVPGQCMTCFLFQERVDGEDLSCIILGSGPSDWIPKLEKWHDPYAMHRELCETAYHTYPPFCPIDRGESQNVYEEFWKSINTL